MTGLSGAAAIVGAGASSFERRPERSVIEMASEAMTAALADAGMEPGQIDGLITQIGAPRGADHDTIAATFGLDIRFASQTWAHGRMTGTVLGQAAMSLACGLASTVMCLISMKNSDIGRIGEADNPMAYEQVRENGGPHAEEGHIGMASPVAGAALAFDLYCTRYGKDRELLAAIPLAFRRHAALTPDAVARAPLDAAGYRASRRIVAPLRLHDCSLVGDGAVCLIVTGRGRAAAARRPVWITGFQGIEAGRETFVFGPRGLGFGQQSRRRRTAAEARARPVYAMAGTRPEGIDVIGIYDSFSPLPVYALEEFGFCAEGEGLDFVQDGRIGLGGALPTNTSGGQLSHAQLNGWAQIRELVHQLRGEAGPRQVPECRVAMWAGCAGDALVLERG